MAAGATATLGFVLFVTRIQYCCLLLQGCGPKFLVLNGTLEPHTVKNTSGQAECVRRGTKDLREAGRKDSSEWLCKTTDLWVEVGLGSPSW